MGAFRRGEPSTRRLNSLLKNFFRAVCRRLKRAREIQKPRPYTLAWKASS